MQIVERYAKWADNYQENQISVLYATMWSGTKTLAEKIAEGIRKADPGVKIKLMNITKSDMNDLVTEVFRSKMVVMGSPTIGNSILPPVAGFIHMLKELKFKNKKAASFGCYGWSGESVKVLNEAMAGAGFQIVGEGFRNQWNPDAKMQSEAVEYGMKIMSA